MALLACSRFVTVPGAPSPTSPGRTAPVSWESTLQTANSLSGIGSFLVTVVALGLGIRAYRVSKSQLRASEMQLQHQLDAIQAEQARLATEAESRPRVVAGVGFLLVPSWRYFLDRNATFAVGHEPVNLDLVVQNVGVRTARNIFIEAFFHLPITSPAFVTDPRHPGCRRWLINVDGALHPGQRRSYSAPIVFGIQRTDFEAVVRIHYDDSPPAEFKLLLGATDDMSVIGATWRRYDLDLTIPEPRTVSE